MLQICSFKDILTDAPIGKNIACQGEHMALEKLDQVMDGQTERDVIEQRSGILFKNLKGLEICTSHRQNLGKGFKRHFLKSCLYSDHPSGRTRTIKNTKKYVSYEKGSEAMRKLGLVIPCGLLVCVECNITICNLVDNADEPMSNDIPLSQESNYSYVSPELEESESLADFEEMDNDDSTYQPSQNREEQVS